MISGWSFVVFFTIALLAAASSLRAEEVQINIDRVMAPSHGYDDNDDVRVVLSGVLDSPCLNLARTQIKRNPSAHTISIIQYAWARHDGACKSGDWIDAPAPYEIEVSLGRMSRGDYVIQGLSQNEPVSSRSIHIAPASATTQDSLNYPIVDGMWVDDNGVLLEGEDIKVTFFGKLTTECASIVAPIQVLIENDVMVILATQKMSNTKCAPSLRPFKTEINLGKLRAGHYLIHIRSRHGQVVQQVITVQTPPLS